MPASPYLFTGREYLWKLLLAITYFPTSGSCCFNLLKFYFHFYDLTCRLLLLYSAALGLRLHLKWKSKSNALVCWLLILVFLMLLSMYLCIFWGSIYRIWENHLPFFATGPFHPCSIPVACLLLQVYLLRIIIVH